MNDMVLERLDAALAREVLRLRARYQLTLDEFRGLYVSDEQVDALLARSAVEPAAPPSLPLPRHGAAMQKVIHGFGLSELDADLLLLALAADVDSKYAPLIAYLNDDVRRRWPTLDLACRLFGAAAADALDPGRKLFDTGLLLALPTSEPRLARPLQEFAPNPILTAHLLGRTVAPASGFTVEAPSAATAPPELRKLAALVVVDRPILAILSGAGAEAAAARSLGRPLVRLRLSGETNVQLVRDATLAARLERAVLLLEPDVACLPSLAPLLADLVLPVLLLAPPGDAWRSALTGCAGLRIEITPPDMRARHALWTTAMQNVSLQAEPADIAGVAEVFRLSPRQIQAAAASLHLSRNGSAICSASNLLAAARAQAGANLAGLAQRVTTAYGWKDLVLPQNCLRQVRKFASAIRHRGRVFGDWGLAGGPGLTALFGGGPGTGKTLCASVLARETGLDLWRIDLSAVTSKYIGETEKNLDRVFTQARDGNVILFFDEADAMFGKRSEVKDAHDRYANIEVAYLLQRLESFEGVVVLCSNLARNVDPAFGRRLHFVIDFPMPDAHLREQLWRAALPAAAPLAADVDLAFIARQFAFAGGDIRVAALDASFSAASDDAPIDMARLLQAVRQQLLKQGKVPQGSDYGIYRTLVAEVEVPMAGCPDNDTRAS